MSDKGNPSQTTKHFSYYSCFKGVPFMLLPEALNIDSRQSKGYPKINCNNCNN